MFDFKMSVELKLFILIALFYWSSNVLSLKMIPERATLDYTNKDYVAGVKFNVRRYSRNGGYYVNLEGAIKHMWGNNISFHVVLYEYLHNEYKPTFIELHFKRLCDLFSDPYLGKAITNAGVKCPASAGSYNLANMSLPCEDFPYIWPFERAKGVGTVTHDNIVLGNGSLYMKFVQKKKSAKNAIVKYP